MAKSTQRTTSFAFFCVVIALAVYFTLNPFGKTVPFKASVWKNEARNPKMALYLVEKKLLKDKTLPQTLEMLGQPDELDTLQLNKIILKYGLANNTQHLQVELDSLKIFKEARIVER